MADERYIPRGTHRDFKIPNEEIPEDKPKEKKEIDLYRYINKKGEMIGDFKAVEPFFAAKKILKQIFMRTGIDNPIFEIYNTYTKKLYKYAGKVEKMNKKKILEIEDKDEPNSNEPKLLRIVVKHKYIIRQICWEKLKDENIIFKDENEK